MGNFEESSVTFFVQFDENKSNCLKLREGFKLYGWEIIQYSQKQCCYILSGNVNKCEIPYKLSKLGDFNNFLLLDNQKQSLNSILKTINTHESNLVLV